MSTIENIEIFFLEYPFPKDLNYQYSGGLVENMIVGLIKITDNEGQYGLGEVTHAQFTHKPIIGLVDHFKDILIGLEIGKINNAWEKMYGSSVFWNREGVAIGVMGGINIAMYDLLGKNFRLPVYQLIGGLAKEKIKIYASNGLFESSEDLIKDANKAYDMGFRIYKMRIIKPDTILNLVKDFKKEFSNRMELIVDAVQGSTANPWANKVSINLAKELEKYKILFFEEPCRVENIEGYKEIKKSTTLNIAGAESIPTARAFKPYLQSEAFDVVQFDIATSGFTEGRRIADLAYTYNKPIAIHSWGSAISIMAGIHFSLTIPNSAFTEYCFMEHPLNELLFENSKIEIKNGYVTRPETYGLGVKFNEEILKKFSYKEKVNTMISTEEADIQLI